MQTARVQALGSANRLRRFLLAVAVCSVFAVSVCTADSVPPKLGTLQFTPEALTPPTSGELTVTFTATDDESGVIYFEAVFLDPAGVMRQSGSTRFAAARSITSAAKIIFPQSASSGTWTLSQVYLTDSSGNVTVLDTGQLVAMGVSTRLDVHPIRDTASPKLTGVAFAPAQIDTSTVGADVKLNFTATDDISGVSDIELVFTSLSGASQQRGSAHFTPTQLLSGAVAVNFPRFSEPGRWTLTSLFLADAAGNTLLLDTAALSRLGYLTVLEVKSAADTLKPNLSSIRLGSDAIHTTWQAASVNVAFNASDDLSGVRFVEVVFVSPSGTIRRSGSVTLTPAHQVSGSVLVSFPQSSEAGRWTLESVLIADAAGNTLALTGEAVSALGFATALNVVSTPDTVPPNLASARFTPESLDTKVGARTVKLSFIARDSLSGVKSIEVIFVSPSGAANQRAAKVFSPANEVTDTIELTFPADSETGPWRLSAFVLTDAAGNTSVIDEDGAARLGIPAVLKIVHGVE